MSCTKNNIMNECIYVLWPIFALLAIVVLIGYTSEYLKGKSTNGVPFEAGSLPPAAWCKPQISTTTYPITSITNQGDMYVVEFLESHQVKGRVYVSEWYLRNKDLKKVDKVTKTTYVYEDFIGAPHNRVDYSVF